MWPGAAAALADASHIAVAKGAFCRMFLPFGQYAKANAVVHVLCVAFTLTVLCSRRAPRHVASPWRSLGAESLSDRHST